MIRAIRRGDPIRASYLVSITDAVNALTNKGVTPPRQVNAPPPADVQNNNPGAESQEAYIEQSRETSERQVFDQNLTNYATFDVVDAVSMKNGRGDTLRLVFKNPE